MKFLALAATASALTLRTKDVSHRDIVKWFLNTGSAEGFMSALDTSKDGKVSVDEVEALLRQHNASDEMVNFGKGIFKSISRGKKNITLQDAKYWEQGIEMIL